MRRGERTRDSPFQIYIYIYIYINAPEMSFICFKRCHCASPQKLSWPAVIDQLFLRTGADRLVGRGSGTSLQFRARNPQDLC